MTPSANELTSFGRELKKGDLFKLHAQGAKKLEEKHEGRIEFKDGDVLEYPGYTNLDAPFRKGSKSLWMQKGRAGFQVDVNKDLFSEKVVTK